MLKLLNDVDYQQQGNTYEWSVDDYTITHSYRTVEDIATKTLDMIGLGCADPVYVITKCTDWATDYCNGLSETWSVVECEMVIEHLYNRYGIEAWEIINPDYSSTCSGHRDCSLCAVYGGESDDDYCSEFDNGVSVCEITYWRVTAEFACIEALARGANEVFWSQRKKYLKGGLV
tara:strand:- start:4741 stop:5265 length:525 start_codon:yes stop_codon:yes gene_type:complete